MFCGTKSGREFDKFTECALATRPAQQVQSPIIDIPAIHYECTIIYNSAMDHNFMDNSLEKLYPKKDYQDKPKPKRLQLMPRALERKGRAALGVEKKK